MEQQEAEVDVSATLEAEYNEMREEFDIGYIVVGIALVFAVLYFTGVIGGDSKPA